MGTVQLIVILLGAMETLTPEIIAMVNAWKNDGAPMTLAELDALEAALRGDRAAVAKVYAANGVV